MTEPFVAVTDSPAGEDLSIEREVLRGVRVEPVPKAPQEALIASTRHADGILCMHAAIDRQVISALRCCRVIARYGTGLDNIDLAAAREADIPVCGVLDYCTQDVADHTIALLLAWSRKIPKYHRFVVERRWNERDLTTGNWGCGPLHRLAGRTLGLLGFGRIGRAVARRAAAFDLRVIAWSPHLDPATAAALGVEAVNREDLLRRADFLSLHVPLTPQTRHIIDASALATMRPGAVIVNTARGDLIDEEALFGALRSGRLGGALLDVYQRAPLPVDHPLRTLENVLFTPHVAFYSEESLQDLRRQAALAVREHLPSVGGAP